MTRYLYRFGYTAEAWKTMTQHPQDRTAVIRGLTEKLGGKMESLYYTFGEYDGFVIADAPDNQTATAIVLAAVSPGHIKSIKTTVVLTTQEMMQAEEKARSVTYQGPTT